MIKIILIAENYLEPVKGYPLIQSKRKETSNEIPFIETKLV